MGDRLGIPGAVSFSFLFFSFWQTVVKVKYWTTQRSTRGRPQRRMPGWAAGHRPRLYFGSNWRTGIPLGCPILAWGDPQNGHNALPKSWMRTTRSTASVRPQLLVKVPGGWLNSGYPGSAGEPGCEFDWVVGGHPGWVTRLPGAPRRAGQNGTCRFFFSSPHFEDFSLVPRNSSTPPIAPTPNHFGGVVNTNGGRGLGGGA